jgi:hypothetical protein
MTSTAQGTGAEAGRGRGEGDDIVQARACVWDGAGLGCELMPVLIGDGGRWLLAAEPSGWDGLRMSQLSKGGGRTRGWLDGEDRAQTMALLMVIV